MSEPEHEGLDGAAQLPDAHALKRAAFLAEYARCGTVTEAAERVGISRRSHYHWLEKDEDYAAKFQDAHEAAIDVLEAEARRRAIGGGDAPGKGKVRGSDLLLIFLLKGARPWKYRDNAKPDAEAQDAGVLGWEQQQALRDLADEVMAERERAPDTSS